MTGIPGPIYENHLKTAYSVKKAEECLAITETSCYHLSEETDWLIGGLRESGAREDYIGQMSGMGLNAPEKIFDRLLAIGVLKERRKTSWRDRVRALVTPTIKLLPAQLQERAFGPLSSASAALNRGLAASVVLSAAGFLGGAAVLLFGRGAVSGGSAGPDGLTVFILVVAGSLLHEVGHSLASAAAGIGFRPIGFSIYLIYPVFYTNVSGIDKLGLKEKVLIDCGGFVLQFLYVLLILAFWASTGSASALEAVRWMMAIILFNLNPLLRTDGYWLYKDVYAELQSRRWARVAHYFYLAAFLVFSVYFLWLVGGRLGGLWRELSVVAGSPREVFSGGYRVLLGAYFLFVGLAGGLQRFQEGHREWQELRKAGAAPAAAPGKAA